MARNDDLVAYSVKPLWRRPWFLIGSGVVLYFLLRRVTTRVSDTPDSGEDTIRTVSGRDIDPLFGWDLTPKESSAFAAALPQRGKEYASIFLQVAREAEVSPFMLAGIMEIETGYGKASVCKGKGPYCVGTAADDYGLMQINKKAHPNFFTKFKSDGTPYWADPLESVRYGGNYLKYLINFFRGNGAGKTVKVGARVAAKCGVIPGRKDDRRPIQNRRLLALYAAASYNAGEGNGIQALASECNPDAVTYHGNYGTYVVEAAERMARAAAEILNTGVV